MSLWIVCIARLKCYTKMNQKVIINMNIRFLKPNSKSTPFFSNPNTSNFVKNVIHERTREVSNLNLTRFFMFSCNASINFSFRTRHLHMIVSYIDHFRSILLNWFALFQFPSTALRALASPVVSMTGFRFNEAVSRSIKRTRSSLHVLKVIVMSVD